MPRIFQLLYLILKLVLSIILFCWCLGCLFSFSVKSQPQQQLLIFADKSTSVDSTLNQQIQKIVKQKTYQFFKHNKNPKVCLSFIYENSASISNQCCRGVYNEFDNNDKDSFEAKQATLRYNQKQLRNKKRWTDELVAYFKNNAPTAKGSEVLACFNHIANTSSAKISAIFVSDLLENSNDIRNMYTTPLDSRQKALEYAKKDIAKMQKLYQLGNLKGKDISIDFIMTSGAMETSKTTAFLQIYWKEICRLLEIEQVSFSTLH